MRIAYLVLAHTNPRLLSRTIGTLSSGDCVFFVHIDQKSDLAPFSSIEKENVTLSSQRVPVYWGEFSVVEATILLLRQALEDSRGCDYVVLASGSDYPLRSGRYIQNFLEKNRGLEFMSMVKMPNLTAGKPLSRLNTLRFPSNQPVRRAVFRALAKLGLGQRDHRNFLGDIEPYAGSMWWALSRDACQHVLDFVERRREIVRFFQHSFAADESFFHTILANSPFKTRARRNLVYDDWSAGGGSPALIEDRHLQMFESQEKVWGNDFYGSGELLFARKFSDASLHLLDRMDAMIARY